MRLLLVAPVAGGERVLEAVGDDARLDGQLQVEVLAAVDELLRVDAHLLRQVPEEPADGRGSGVEHGRGEEGVEGEEGRACGRKRERRATRERGRGSRGKSLPTEEGAACNTGEGKRE